MPATKKQLTTSEAAAFLRGEFPAQRATSTEALMAERRAEYGEAWLLTGKITELLTVESVMGRIMLSEYFYNWMIILNKLVRLLQSPHKQDSWRDIEVYARLVADRMENLAAAERNVSSD